MSKMLELLKYVLPRIERSLEQYEISYVDEFNQIQILMTNTPPDTFFTKNADNELALISKDPKIIGNVINSYFDLEKKLICKALRTPLIRIDLVDKLKLSCTSTYRKIDQLTDAGLLFRIRPWGYKESSAYVSTFTSITAKISDNMEIAELILNPNIVKILCENEDEYDVK